MAKDILTLALEGEVSLQDFASVIHNFNLLLVQLSAEVGGNADIEWVIDDLSAGSATATFRGNYQDINVVESVVDAYERVGSALALGVQIPYSDKVKRYSTELTGIINGKISAVRFETQTNDYWIGGKLQGEKSASIKYSFGTVKGTVETLSKHKTLSFTLWDSLFDKSVKCYFKEGEEEKMRDIWGKKAVVSGRLGRQPLTGKVVVVRDVNYVRPLEEVEPGSYQHARGALQWKESEETAEEMIRRLRNAA
jgi:hypothetical protein